MPNIADHPNLKIFKRPLLDAKADAIVVPQSHLGVVAKTLEDFVSRTACFPDNDTKFGDIDPRGISVEPTGFKYLIFAVSSGPLGPTYSAVRRIGQKIGQFAQSQADIQVVACGVIGAGSGDLLAVDCIKILAKAFFENSQKELHIYTNDEAVYQTITNINISEFNATSSTNFAFGPSVKKSLNHVDVQPILHATEFWFDLAKRKLDEFMNFSGDVDFFPKLANEFKIRWSTFEKTLASFPASSSEYRFLFLCGELTAYMDQYAANKEKWNQYPDKRTLALSRVHQQDWILNLIKFRETKALEKIAPTVANAIGFLLNPESDLNMLSNRHRGYLMSNIFGINYQSTSDFESLFSRFHFWGARATNPLNTGALITRILYLDYVAELWNDDLEQNNISSLFPGNLEPVGEPVIDDELKSRTTQSNFLADRYATIDLLNFDLYAKAIAAFINHKNTVPPLTIGIFAPWGKGKTTLMHFVEEKLIEYRQNNSDKQGSAPTIEAVTTSNKLKIWLGRASKLFQKSKPRESGDHPVEPITTYRKLKTWLGRASKQFQKSKTLEYPTVWFNPWKFQKPEEVWAGFAHEIIKQLVQQLDSDDTRNEFWLRLNLKRIDQDKLKREILIKIFNKFIFSAAGKISLIASLVAAFSINIFLKLPFYIYGLCPASVLLTFAAKKKKEEREHVDFDLSKYLKQPEYAAKRGYFVDLEEDLKQAMELLISKDRPAVIFIDDLDRCSPNIVATVVESINLFINGDFPRVFFVLGQDAQMVAAALDVAYEKINSASPANFREQGSLGWHFMEKFIQMQFVIPTFNEKLAMAFFRNSLNFGRSHLNTTERDTIIQQAAELEQKIDSSENIKEVLNDETSKIESDLLVANPKAAVALQEKIIDKTADQFDDDDPQLENVINVLAPYLATSPRAVKRFINLYRFYTFLQLSNLNIDLARVDSLHLGQWIILMIRWPQLVRAIQWQADGDFLKGRSAAERAANYAVRYNNLDKNEACPAWANDENLISFIDFCKERKNSLENAVLTGVW